MSTPLTDRITALTAQANAVTGASDTTLTDAVGTLIEGFGGGGTDIVVMDDTADLSTEVANMFFRLIGGEIGKIYAVILKQAASEVVHQQALGMVFARYDASANCIGGMIRYNSSGARYQGLPVTTTYNARVTVGDIYTVYTL